MPLIICCRNARAFSRASASPMVCSGPRPRSWRSPSSSYLKIQFRLIPSLPIVACRYSPPPSRRRFTNLPLSGLALVICFCLSRFMLRTAVSLSVSMSENRILADSGERVNIVRIKKPLFHRNNRTMADSSFATVRLYPQTICGSAYRVGVGRTLRWRYSENSPHSKWHAKSAPEFMPTAAGSISRLLSGARNRGSSGSGLLNAIRTPGRLCATR